MAATTTTRPVGRENKNKQASNQSQQQKTTKPQLKIKFIEQIS